MPPKKKSKEPKAPVADPGEAQQQAFVRQALQSNVMALKERLKTVADDNEEFRKSRSKVRCRVFAIYLYDMKGGCLNVRDYLCLVWFDVSRLSVIPTNSLRTSKRRWKRRMS
jgi:hypothetical protein